MTVTKSKNLIANRNTGGNKKQGLVSSIGKSNSVRQSQLVRASSNDKTIYCINQVGGVGRFRNQISSADSTNCMPNIYTINSALLDSIKLLDKYNNTYLFSYILIHNIKFNDTHVLIHLLLHIFLIVLILLLLINFLRIKILVLIIYYLHQIILFF